MRPLVHRQNAIILSWWWSAASNNAGYGGVSTPGASRPTTFGNHSTFCLRWNRKPQRLNVLELRQMIKWVLRFVYFRLFVARLNSWPGNGVVVFCCLCLAVYVLCSSGWGWGWTKTESSSISIKLQTVNSIMDFNLLTISRRLWA